MTKKNLQSPLCTSVLCGCKKKLQFKRGAMHFFKQTIICITMLFIGYQLALGKATLNYILGNKMCKPNTFYVIVYMCIIRSLEFIEYFFINPFYSF